MGLPADQIGRIYLRHANSLRRFLRSRVGCGAVAEELAQDIFLRLCTTDSTAAIGNPKSYLFRMAHNVAVDYHRWLHRKSGPGDTIDLHGTAIADMQLASPERSVEEELSFGEEMRDVDRSLKRVSELCRQIFWLSRGFGFSNCEIASMLGVCVSTVEKNLAKATRCFHSVPLTN